jgi:hypothetical protein
MTFAACPQLATVAEAARIPGVSRGRVLELAASAHDVRSAKPTTTHGRVQPQAALAGASPASQDIYTGPAASLTALGSAPGRTAHETDRPQTQTRKGGKGRQGCGIEPFQPRTASRSDAPEVERFLVPLPKDIEGGMS